MSWKNLGDINPASGTFLIRNPTINSRGDFEAEAVDVTPESNVGGDDRRFLIRQGNLYLSRDNFSSAVEVLGQRISADGKVILTNDGEIELDSDDGLVELAHATMGYGGIDDVDISTLVQIGVDTPYSQDRKFTGDLVIYRSNASLWSVMERELDGFDYPHGKPKASPIRVVEEPCESGMQP